MPAGRVDGGSRAHGAPGCVAEARHLPAEPTHEVRLGPRDLRQALALKAAKRRGTEANRPRAVASKFCGFCEEQGWRTEGLGVLLPRPVVERARDRILTAEEVGALWNALQEVRDGLGSVDKVTARSFQSCW